MNVLRADATKEEVETWAMESKLLLETRIRDLDLLIEKTRAAARAETRLEPKISLHRLVLALERERREKWRTQYEEEDRIDEILEERLGRLQKETP